MKRILWILALSSATVFADSGSDFAKAWLKKNLRNHPQNGFSGHTPTGTSILDGRPCNLIFVDKGDGVYAVSVKVYPAPHGLDLAVVTTDQAEIFADELGITLNEDRPGNSNRVSIMLDSAGAPINAMGSSGYGMIECVFPIGAITGG